MHAVLAFDIGGTHTKSGIIAADGTLLDRLTVPSEAGDGRDAVIACLQRLYAHYTALAAQHGWYIAAIGAGSAGYFDRLGKVAYATDNIPGWTGFDLRGYLENLSNLPASAANDVYAIAGGEAWLGAGRHLKRFLCVALGTGIGACLWENGAPYRGDAGFAGSLGHQMINRNGRACTCGRNGCWEAYASVLALRRDLMELDTGLLAANPGETGCDPQRLFKLARAGQPEALKLVDQYAEHVASGLANAVYALDVEKVIIAGAISQQGAFLTDRIAAKLKQVVIPMFARPELAVIPAELGDDAGIYGAAAMALND